MKEVFTQETLPDIIPSKIALAVDLIARRNGEDPVKIVPRFYASDVYAKLSDETTKYWWFSPAELCELYLRETCAQA